ncbi:MAG: hypothetical protein ACTSX4_01710 [Candidatus Helarchaeota archaeon]
MKKIELAILNSEIRAISENFSLVIDDDADVVDIIAAADKKLFEILGNRPFPIDIFNNLLHLLYNPKTGKFYTDVGVEARDKDGKWLPIAEDTSIQVPDQSYIYLTPDAGC